MYIYIYIHIHIYIYIHIYINIYVCIYIYIFYIYIKCTYAYIYTYTYTYTCTYTIFAIDSNARSTSWHDMLTKKRGKTLEEFLLSRQLHIANEESCCTTFRTCRGASNIDLTIINNQAIDFISDWAVHDQESCSDHNIIKYGFGNENVTFRLTGINMVGVRYRVTQRDIAKFQGNFIPIIEQLLSGTNKAVGGVEKLDESLCQRVATAPNMDEIIEELHEVLDSACRSSFRLTRLTRTTKKVVPCKSVPWWTQRQSRGKT